MPKETLADGSVWDIDFSKDPEEKYSSHLADGVNEHVRVFARPEQSKSSIISAMAVGNPAMSSGVHSIATDSQGNIYTTVSYTGKRPQKFVNKGVTAQSRPSTRRCPAGTVTIRCW